MPGPEETHESARRRGRGEDRAVPQEGAHGKGLHGRGRRRPRFRAPEARGGAVRSSDPRPAAAGLARRARCLPRGSGARNPGEDPDADSAGHDREQDRRAGRGRIRNRNGHCVYARSHAIRGDRDVSSRCPAQCPGIHACAQHRRQRARLRHRIDSRGDRGLSGFRRLAAHRAYQ